MITLYPGNKLRVTFSWTYSGPPGTYYAMVQLGSATSGVPFQAVLKKYGIAITPATQSQVVVDLDINAAIPENQYEIEADICSDATGTDQSIIKYVQGPLDDIVVSTQGIFSTLVVTYTKV